LVGSPAKASFATWSLEPRGWPARSRSRQEGSASTHRGAHLARGAASAGRWNCSPACPPGERRPRRRRPCAAPPRRRRAAHPRRQAGPRESAPLAAARHRFRRRAECVPQRPCRATFAGAAGPATRPPPEKSPLQRLGAGGAQDGGQIQPQNAEGKGWASKPAALPLDAEWAGAAGPWPAQSWRWTRVRGSTRSSGSRWQIPAIWGQCTYLQFTRQSEEACTSASISRLRQPEHGSHQIICKRVYPH
jgi:hypothetical protein